jgi:uncharacterized protein YndB with AHSA1/START domain
MIPNEVESEILIEAAIERVWAAVTQLEYVTRWYGVSAAAMELRAGGAMELSWPQHGSFRGHVSRVEPPHVLSYRCAVHPGQHPRVGNSTLIELNLRAEGTATRLHVVESGFRSLAVPDAEKAEYVAGARADWQERLAGIPECVAQITDVQMTFTSTPP